LGNQLNDHYLPAKRIAHAAAELEGDARRSYVEREAGNDPDLANEVWWMISAIEATGTAGLPKLGEPDPDLSGSAAQATAPRNYRIVRRIGEGGMGVVYLAERSDGDFVQQVALKFLNTAAEDSPTRLERFAQERQLLARMEHPGIARLLDGGVLHDGRPFLAMEYIEGERIDHWCARRELSLRERVALFVKVCAAVEYAHRHLVIHRDIKPANILVTGDGEPKLLDFGIARMLSENGHAAPTETVHHSLTLAYASPEQIEQKLLTTAADVYSLGVVFYELVSGRRPFHQMTTPHQLSSAIMQGVVPPPSRHATQTGGDPTGQHRHWFRRSRILPADIDAIALKAMRREASKRYATVAELGDDLERFLSLRAVRAMRGRFSYRLGRYMRRNRWPLAAATAVFLAIVGALFASLYALEQARTQQRLAELRQHEMERSVAFQQSMLESVDIDAMGKVLIEALRKRTRANLLADGQANADIPPQVANAAKELLRRAVNGVSAADIARDALDAQVVSHALDNIDDSVGDDPLLAADLRQSLARVLITIGSYDHASEAMDKVLDTRSKLLPRGDRRLSSAKVDLGRTLLLRGNVARAADLFDQAVADTASLPIDDKLRIAAEAGQARVLASQGHGQRARALQESLYRQLRAALPESDPDLMRLRRDLVATLIDLGMRDEAIAHVESLARLDPATFGPESLETLDTTSTFAELLEYRAEHERALAIAMKNVAIRERRQGSGHPATLRDLHTAATALLHMNRADEAYPLLQRALKGRQLLLGKDNPQTLDSMSEMVRLYAVRKDYPAAIALQRTLLASRRRVLGVDHPNTLFTQGGLASLLIRQGSYAEALAGAKATLAAQRRVLGVDHPITFETLDLVARAEQAAGHLPQARDAFREALDKRNRALGPMDFYTLQTAMHLYGVLHTLHDAPAESEVRKHYLEPLLARDPATLNSGLLDVRKETLAMIGANAG
jgi:serine/threonine-protein kinase